MLPSPLLLPLLLLLLSSLLPASSKITGMDKYDIRGLPTDETDAFCRDFCDSIEKCNDVFGEKRESSYTRPFPHLQFCSLEPHPLWGSLNSFTAPLPTLCSSSQSPPTPTSCSGFLSSLRLFTLLLNSLLSFSLFSPSPPSLSSLPSLLFSSPFSSFY